MSANVVSSSASHFDICRGRQYRMQPADSINDVKLAEIMEGAG